jgi:hypothetical protein
MSEFIFNLFFYLTNPKRLVKLKAIFLFSKNMDFSNFPDPTDAFFPPPSHLPPKNARPIRRISGREFFVLKGVIAKIARNHFSKIQALGLSAEFEMKISSELVEMIFDFFKEIEKFRAINSRTEK